MDGSSFGARSNDIELLLVIGYITFENGENIYTMHALTILYKS